MIIFLIIRNILDIIGNILDNISDLVRVILTTPFLTVTIRWMETKCSFLPPLSGRSGSDKLAGMKMLHSSGHENLIHNLQ